MPAAGCALAQQPSDTTAEALPNPHRSEPRARSWEQVDDLDAFVADVIAQYPPGTPVFQGAQSMGGLMTLHSALRSQSRLRGIVLTSALVNVQYTPILRCAERRMTYIRLLQSIAMQRHGMVSLAAGIMF